MDVEVISLFPLAIGARIPSQLVSNTVQQTEEDATADQLSVDTQ